MGAIMSLGVATANSVLVVSFARENLQHGLDPVSAALEAGIGRIRPVLMTAIGHDHRHVADEPWRWRRRRTKCAARSRGHRRSCFLRPSQRCFLFRLFSVSCIGITNRRQPIHL
ncbi:MAG: efflux RND transporter permease subunit [Limisphaerales bacterium]